MVVLLLSPACTHAQGMLRKSKVNFIDIRRPSLYRRPATTRCLLREHKEVQPPLLWAERARLSPELLSLLAAPKCPLLWVGLGAQRPLWNPVPGVEEVLHIPLQYL